MNNSFEKHIVLSTKTGILLSMTRNIELLRAILEQAERAPAGEATVKWPAPKEFADQGIGQKEMADHVKQLIELNLVEGDARMVTGTWIIRRLTSKGHDFLANARTEGAWKAAMAKAGNASVEIFAAVLGAIAAKQFE